MRTEPPGALTRFAVSQLYTHGDLGYVWALDEKEARRIVRAEMRFHGHRGKQAQFTLEEAPIGDWTPPAVGDYVAKITFLDLGWA